MSLKNIIEQIDTLKKELDSLPLMTLETKEKLDKKFRLEFHYNSNHIEGNTLTYGDTELLLVFDETRGSHSLREYEEMKASDVALEMVKDLAENKKEPLSQAFIKNLNKTLLVRPYWKEAVTPQGETTKRKISVGEYKKHPNSVLLQNGEMFHYTSPQETPIQMNELIDWFKISSEANDLHPLELAALLHYKFVCIHPFDDGNGRLSRLLMNYVLFYYNYPAVIIKSDDKSNYLSSLHDADTGNIDSFIKYIGKQLIWSLKLTIESAKGEPIDEKEDWKKALTILKRELSHKEEIKEKKTNIVLSKLINSMILPLIGAIKISLKDVSDLFLVNRIYLVGSSTSYTSNISPVNYEIVTQEYMNYIQILFHFKEFKKNGSEPFDLDLEMHFDFEDYKYLVAVEEAPFIEKLYHQTLSSFEIEELINQLGKLAVTKLSRKLKIDV